jgi:superfamily II DNA or RNA helicase
MKYSLRDYQARDADRLRASFRAGKRAPIYVLPTGGGKTFVFCYVSENASKIRMPAGNYQRVMVLVHRKELLIQASLSMAKIGLKHSLVAQDKHIREAIATHVEEFSDSFIDTDAPVMVASVDTLIRRVSLVKPPDLIICDETHHCIPSNKWGAIIKSFPGARILGVTATPTRTDGKGLGRVAGGFFDDMVLGPTMRELIDDGYLKQPKVFAPPSLVDLAGVKTTGGDYAAGELAKRVDKPAITGDAVDHYARICPHWPAIAFCVSIQHAKHVAEEFRARGFDFRVIDGTMHDSERRKLIRALATGKIDGLTSCDIISEGTDIPVVACAIKLRPTKSEGLNLQQDGRTLRPIYAPGFDMSTREGRRSAIAASKYPYSVILDHVGNCFIHGLPDSDREWTLEGKKKRKKGEGDKEERRKALQCPKCYGAHDPAPVCPYCGHEYENGGNARSLEQVDGELKEVTGAAAEALRKVRKQEERRATTYEDFVKLGEERGYSNPRAWARIRMGFKKNREASTI